MPDIFQERNGLCPTGYYYSYYLRPFGLFLWNVINLDEAGVTYSVSTLRYTAGGSGFRFLIRERGFSIFEIVGQLWDTPSPLFNGCRLYIPGRWEGKFRGMTLTTHQHVVLWLRMTGSVPALTHTSSSLGREEIYF
jgi:hypothetical protein